MSSWHLTATGGTGREEGKWGAQFWTQTLKSTCLFPWHLSCHPLNWWLFLPPVVEAFQIFELFSIFFFLNPICNPLGNASFTAYAACCHFLLLLCYHSAPSPIISHLPPDWLINSSPCFYILASRLPTAITKASAVSGNTSQVILDPCSKSAMESNLLSKRENQPTDLQDSTWSGLHFPDFSFHNLSLCSLISSLSNLLGMLFPLKFFVLTIFPAWCAPSVDIYLAKSLPSGFAQMSPSQGTYPDCPT